VSHAAALVVDRKGLAKKLAHRPKSFVLFELLQNSWDESDATQVTVTAEMLPGAPVCRIFVKDDAPGGFENLESVYTMFRDSKKASDPEKRGRFELGEKLVAALALRMDVVSTKGSVTIEVDGTRHHSRRKTEVGSEIMVDIRMTRAEFEVFCADARRLLQPAHMSTTFNGEVLPIRIPLHTFYATLQTVRADADGNLVPTTRKTAVEVYEVLRGEVAHLFEMGIPVVETGDRYHYNVMQRVPVNFERSSVPPAYLKTLRVSALNALHERITGDDVTAPWVSDAIDDSRCDPEAIKRVVTERFGDKAVINDLSDPEGTKIAVSQGYTVIPGGSFSKGAWENIRQSGAVLPAGQVTPSPKVYAEEGRGEHVIPPEKWTGDMGCRAQFAADLLRKLTGKSCYVVIVNEPQASWSANFGKHDDGYRLCLNYGRLGKRWFVLPQRATDVLDLLLHEFAHAFSSDHLSSEYHGALSMLGAQIANLALNEPEFFQ